MALTEKQIKDSLGRVKAYYQRNETNRALDAAIYAMENLGGSVPTTVRSAIREAIQLLSRDEKIKKHTDPPLFYQPGNEKLILQQLVHAYTKIKEHDAIEEHAKSLERKINIDKFFNEGIKALSNKQSSEADENFMQSIANYKDEHHLFCMIAQALKDAGEIRRAYPYAKRGTEVAPNSEKAKQLFLDIEKARAALA